MRPLARQKSSSPRGPSGGDGQRNARPCRRFMRLPLAVLSLSQPRRCSHRLPVVTMWRAPLWPQSVTANRRRRRQPAVQCKCLQRGAVPARQSMLLLPVVRPSCTAAACSRPHPRGCRHQQWMQTATARLALTALPRARSHLTGQTSQPLLLSLRSRTHCSVINRWILWGEPLAHHTWSVRRNTRARCCYRSVILNLLSCRPGDDDEADPHTPARLQSQHTLAAGVSTVPDPEQELEGPEFGPLGPRLDPDNPWPSAATAAADHAPDGDQRDGLSGAADAPAAGSGVMGTAPGESEPASQAGQSALDDDGTAAAASCVPRSSTHMHSKLKTLFLRCDWLHSVVVQRCTCDLRGDHSGSSSQVAAHSLSAHNLSANFAHATFALTQAAGGGWRPRLR